MAALTNLRVQLHETIASRIIRFATKHGREFPNYADGSSRTSVEIANRIADLIGCRRTKGRLDGQTIGRRFEKAVCEFLREAFALLHHIRPGKWAYLTEQTSISRFVQYCHLAELTEALESDVRLATTFGHGYIITPDIVIARHSVSDEEINRCTDVVAADQPVARLSPLRMANLGSDRLLLHASVSCKWTIRSDRSQNTRTEALNLIRNRKGPTPHIAAVTAEPLPMRIASLALGTGDLDCVYHIALPELVSACKGIKRGEDQLEMLQTMIEGNRLRDISDLPLDFAI